MTEGCYRGVLIGCGFFARNQIQAWRGIDRAAITAVCDLDAAKAAAFAAEFGVPRSYGDARLALRQEKPDFVDIVTTSASHRALVTLAAEQGVPVICQKPFADTLEDAAAMVEATRRAGVPLLVHENFRWQHPLREMAARIAAGQIGTPHTAQLSFRHGYDNYRNQPYLKTIERFAIMDVGLHLFDLARWIMGEVDSVFCRTQRLNPEVRGEDAFTANLRHAAGGVSLVDCSFHTVLRPEPFPQVTARVEGEHGTLELLRDYRLLCHRRDGLEVIAVEPVAPPWAERPWHVVQDSVAALQRHWIEVLDGATGPQPSGADNYRTLQVALAAYDSAAQDRAIDLAPQEAAA